MSFPILVGLLAATLGLSLLGAAAMAVFLRGHIFTAVSERLGETELDVRNLKNKLNDIAGRLRQQEDGSRDDAKRLAQEVMMISRELEAVQSRLSSETARVRPASPSADYRKPAGDPLWAATRTAEVPLPSPPASPPPSFTAVLTDYRALLASRAVSATAFDKVLEGHGQLYDAVCTKQGHLDLVAYSSGNPMRTLTALVSGDAVLLVPSSNFINEFPMIYKETLDASAEINLAFDMLKDGNGWPAYLTPATGRRNLSGQVVDIKRGELGGFVR